MLLNNFMHDEHEITFPGQGSVIMLTAATLQY